MWPLAVVMVEVDAEDRLEMATVEDQQPVETLGSNGANKALGDRVRLRRSHRRLHDPYALAAEDLVEGAAVLAVAVDGSSPSEGFSVLPAQSLPSFSGVTPAGCFAVHRAPTSVRGSNSGASNASRSLIACSRPSRSTWP